MNSAIPTAKIEGNTLVLRIPLQEPQLSSTGKTMLVGQMSTPYDQNLRVNGKPVRVNATAFIKP